MLDEALALLRCPHCAEGLARAGQSVTCPNGHSFDVARQGYVSLLAGDARLGTADTAAMVAARQGFLEAGHFDGLAEAIGDEAERALGEEGEQALGEEGERALGEEGERPLGEEARTGALLDLGAGTGWYLARLLDRFPGRLGLALDLSKHALRRAARAHSRIAAVACDAWSDLPVKDGAAGLVLSVFAPRNGPEIARVLQSGGVLLVVTPTAKHLGELVSAFGLLTVDERKEERLAAQLETHLELERRVEREWPLALTRDDVAKVVAMGPSAHHVSDELDIHTMDATASVLMSTYRRRTG